MVQGYWELAGQLSGSEMGGLRWPGWDEGPQSGYAAGAGSVGSAADVPSSQHISAAPCGRTDDPPEAAASGTPTMATDTETVQGKVYDTYIIYVG